MIRYTARAERQLRDLRDAPDAGFSAPRPYPKIARGGRAWVHSGRYWIAYTTTAPPVIVAVFYNMANIPGRL